jgi:hypothetical protein
MITAARIRRETGIMIRSNRTGESAASGRAENKAIITGDG